LTSHTIDGLVGVEGKVTLGGLVTRVRQMKIKSGPNEGKMMGRFVLEDLTGGLSATVFATNMPRFGAYLVEDQAVVVTGLIRDRGTERELTVEELVPLERATGKLLREVELTVDAGMSRGELLAFKDFLLENAGDVALKLRVAIPGYDVEVTQKQVLGVRYDEALHQALEQKLGRDHVKPRYYIRVDP
jgi:DNA polymerase III alpha subunit